jgi:hypothetical protein
MRRSATLLALVLLASGAAAQPALVVAPDTLVAPGEGRIVNVGADSLRLDSLGIGPCPQGECGYGFAGHVAYGSAVASWYLIPGFSQASPLSSPGAEVVLAPGDSAALAFTWIDPCPVCLRGPSGWDFVAPLAIWAGGDPTPVVVPLAFDTPVAAEPGPGGPGAALALAGPNPFTRGTVLLLHLDASAEVDVALYDALGRRVRTVRAGRLAAGAHRLPVAAEGLAPGLYFARAVVGAGRGATVATRRLVVLR